MAVNGLLRGDGEYIRRLGRPEARRLSASVFG